MTEIILETLIDGLKLIPFFFVAFLLIEIIEHKLTGKSKKIINKAISLRYVINKLIY